jgi:subtilisin-like proprotein convertase family protein
VKHILAETATLIDFVDPAPASVYGALVHPSGSTYGAYVYDYKWVQNADGKWFSNWYGFGLVDADAAVSMASTWVPAPAGPLGTYVRTEDISGNWTHTDATIVPIPEADMVVGATSTIAGVTSLSIEAVQVRLSTNHPNPEQLAVHLVSPSLTESRLVLVDSGIVKFGSNDYYFMSNAFYGEDSGGVWTIKVYDPEDIGATLDTGDITGWGINIHGH